MTLTHVARYGRYVNDWWFAARPDVVHTWGRLHDDFSWYASTARREKLLTWSHYFWPLHIHRVLNRSADVRFSGEVQVALARRILPHLRPCAPPKPNGSAAGSGHRGCRVRPVDYVGSRCLPSGTSASSIHMVGTDRRVSVPAHLQGWAGMCPVSARPESEQPSVCCGGECEADTCDEATLAHVEEARAFYTLAMGVERDAGRLAAREGVWRRIP